MSVREKLFFMGVVIALLAWAGHGAMTALRPKPPSPRQIGLEWLRQEYQVPEDAYQKIIALHEDYFVRCDQMCATMEQAHRPLLQRGRMPLGPEQRREALRKEKAVCESCLDSMVQHLRTVAGLMPADEGRRFLNDILPEVINPPELQQLRTEVPPVQ